MDIAVGEERTELHALRFGDSQHVALLETQRRSSRTVLTRRQEDMLRQADLEVLDLMIVRVTGRTVELDPVDVAGTSKSVVMRLTEMTITESQIHIRQRLTDLG